ncbi:unnamed protein product [Lupinus luteus]|uniref:NAD(P)-binding domain-containing protein n=1 Tax=Lupinus luteus TaxID=3873 RepID=A0AAV1WRA4_LUPLU
MTSFLSFSAVSARTIPSVFSLKTYSFQFQTPTPTLHFKPNRFAIRSIYADAGVRDDCRSNTKDVVADIRSERIVVLGGSGFVGSAICKAAISKGIEAISLSRSGRPTYPGEWVDQVTWLSGDVFNVNWDEVLVGATAVVSTLGGFGSEEHMRRINGEANAVAVKAAKEYGIPKFILISVHDYNLPPFLLTSGYLSEYFKEKRKAESEVLSKYPTSGVVLRPRFIYGKRKLGDYEIPLDLIGEPIERILKAIENFTKPLSFLPASDLILAPPVSVDNVALALLMVSRMMISLAFLRFTRSRKLLK